MKKSLNQISNLAAQKQEDNLSIRQIHAFRKLQKNKNNLIIRKADKGSAVVLQSRENYIWEGQRQLQDTNYYRKLDAPIFPETAKEFSNLLTELVNIPGALGGKNINGWCGINKRQRDFLAPDTKEKIRERRFYMLPKIHKDPAKWPTPNLVPPGRPIVSDCSSESYQIAAFIDYFLQPLACSHPSYIKDTNHFLNRIADIKVNNDSLLVTADVDAMYTNIGPWSWVTGNSQYPGT